MEEMIPRTIEEELAMEQVCSMEGAAEPEPLPENPVNKYLRMDRMPHIWCPGCGIGTTMNCFARAIDGSKLDPNQVAIVSGIGCTGRVAGYVNMDSFHTTHGRAIPFATGLKLGNPALKVVVYSGDGDLFAIGGNHFIHAARRNMDLTVICVNNFIYGMTGGQVTPTTPEGAVASTTPYGNYEHAFNLPDLAAACGAVYVARWTSFHVRQLTKAMKEALAKPGFSFIEIISPCPTLYSRRNKLGDGLDQMEYYKEFSDLKPGASTRDVAINFQDKIVVGKFVDIQRPTWLAGVNSYYAKIFGDRYAEYKG
jgi:2-oxoglutarate ferredoxin oxidoreductase subunit beta